MTTADNDSPHQAMISNAWSISSSFTHHNTVGMDENNDQLLTALPPML